LHFCPGSASDHDIPTYILPHSWDHRHACCHTQLTDWDEVLLAFGSIRLKIWSSWITGIIGISHHTWP
jgi:hypothetical protein